MKLKYPNGRLLIFNLLHQEDLRCNEALVKGAYALGLITKSDSSPNGNAKSVDCGSPAILKNIIRTYFDQRQPNMTEEEKAKSVEHVLAQVNKDISDFKTEIGITHPNTAPSKMECGNLAPATFDFLLQHLQYFA
ncbi:MAG: hypothetical protein K2Y22_10315 [Candidatus Obscuribacterales bacterium]|nr:hypothetical protein [Candidatus Obscuribacterales bacterium]